MTHADRTYRKLTRGVYRLLTPSASPRDRVDGMTNRSQAALPKPSLTLVRSRAQWPADAPQANDGRQSDSDTRERSRTIGATHVERGATVGDDGDFRGS
ncbi:hypothetical protein CMK11_06565 [Candidatus Poribacteria bacterium]|nr:hypothetical protein [Candidatus Poribacteria bacterium]